MVARNDEPAEPIIAKLQLTKRMEVTLPVTITKLVCVPKKVRGRIELHWFGQTDGNELVELEKGSIKHILDLQASQRV
jgi:hypothetical protein